MSKDLEIDCDIKSDPKGIKENRKFVSWAHLEIAFDIDTGTGGERRMPKLTEEHVKKEKMRKMKVAPMAQVFSRSVSNNIRDLAKKNGKIKFSYYILLFF